ncbi:hypothetical protein E8E12_005031 [Didymella heteroderae]|uniref:Tachykinin family protein n=1 Tax=Didymella heteroderae TaxID=1769908 RepID=A0A9P4WKH5_9PLEO|nr:hypothetical protein E8E12_005031 [Didymella heteroderae]
MAAAGSCTAAEGSPASSDATNQSKEKLKRRRVKREGPPQLQFLIATDPSQFKDEDAKRSVRSQAMIHWRHEEDKKKRKGSRKDLTESAPAPPERESIPTRTKREVSTQSRTESPVRGGAQRRTLRAQPSSLISDSDVSPLTNAGSSTWQLTASGTAGYFPRYQNKIRAVAEREVTGYEASERHEERQLRSLVVGLASFYNVGGTQDPFDVLPQFRNPRLDALYLSRNCMRAFASDATMKKWLPLMLSHPHIILSATVLASTWLDMGSKVSGDSTTTAMVKTETIGMIKERFANRDTQFDDATLIVILHLFAGEMWTCNEQALRVHERGVAAFISRRGGLSAFVHNRALAEVALACCYHCDIFCEAEVLQAFRENLPSDSAPVSAEAALPESPLYCPRNAFLTIIDDARCSMPTLDILSDMRDLTNIFVAHNTKLNQVHDIDAVDIERLSPPDEASEATIHAIRARLAQSPSAYTQGISVSGDWVYEACRIAATIYTGAIATGVPFSVAADPDHVNLLEPSTSHWNSDEQLTKPHLSEVLYETLKRADTSNLWKNMSGVLYWVSAVGAAAARIPCTMDMAQQDRFAPGAYSDSDAVLRKQDDVDFD